MWCSHGCSRQHSFTRKSLFSCLEKKKTHFFSTISTITSWLFFIWPLLKSPFNNIYWNLYIFKILFSAHLYCVQSLCSKAFVNHFWLDGRGVRDGMRSWRRSAGPVPRTKTLVLGEVCWSPVDSLWNPATLLRTKILFKKKKCSCSSNRPSVVLPSLWARVLPPRPLTSSLRSHLTSVFYFFYFLFNAVGLLTSDTKSPSEDLEKEHMR